MTQHGIRKIEEQPVGFHKDLLKSQELFPPVSQRGPFFDENVFSKEILKTGMLLESSFSFEEKACLKNLYLDGHHDLKFSRPTDTMRSPELFQRPSGVAGV